MSAWFSKFIACSIIIAVIGGAIIVMARKRRPAKQDNKDAKQVATKVLNDAEIWARLKGKWPLAEVGTGELFCFSGERLISMLVEQLHADYKKMDMLLSDIIEISQGAFLPAATEGEDFDFRKMTSARILPSDAKVNQIKHRGLIRAATDEVVLKAEVL